MSSQRKSSSSTVCCTSPRSDASSLDVWRASGEDSGTCFGDSGEIVGFCTVVAVGAQQLPDLGAGLPLTSSPLISLWPLTPPTPLTLLTPLTPLVPGLLGLLDPLIPLVPGLLWLLCGLMVLTPNALLT